VLGVWIYAQTSEVPISERHPSITLPIHHLLECDYGSEKLECGCVGYSKRAYRIGEEVAKGRESFNNRQASASKAKVTPVVRWVN
jgi:hypothetical protein